MTTIVVAGDLIIDYDLVRHPTSSSNRPGLSDDMVHTKNEGGAWYLNKIIKLACHDIDDKPIQHAPIYSNEIVCNSRSYQLWVQMEQIETAEQKNKKVLRIQQFMGVKKDNNPDSNMYKLDHDVDRPDILVLDDLGLSFSNDKRLWPSALTHNSGPKHIIIKTIAAPDDSDLWKQLLKKEYRERLTVILSASALRARGAYISHALSWDKTIEEVAAELENGVSQSDLGQCRRVIILFACSGVASFTRKKMMYYSYKDSEHEKLNDCAKFERLVYDSMHHEGCWRERRPGRILGALSIVTAAVVRHEVNPKIYPLFFALKNSLLALRKNHELGVSIDDNNRFDPFSNRNAIKDEFNDKEERQNSNICNAYPNFNTQCQYVDANRKLKHSNILRDLTGSGRAYVAAKATEVVLYGPTVALRQAPKVRYGHYVTVDREEIERINAIHKLITDYKEKTQDTKPLSIAVFGPPGSGKSFSIKQLLSTIFEKQEPLEFNLSQFHTREDLVDAFDWIRDSSIKGQVPLVFWDEFDTDELTWLKSFLSPMQDGLFRIGSDPHPIGRAIFVFAGSTSRNFDHFIKPISEGLDESLQGQEFSNKKGPDFVSRLKGFVNIKGPNPTPDGEANSDEKNNDASHIIRRAILLRESLRNYYPSLIDADNIAHISTSVVYAFLHVNKFIHGARSLDSLVSMSSPKENYFNVSALPSTDLLKLHASQDFTVHLQEGQEEVLIIKHLAKAYCEYEDKKNYDNLNNKEKTNYKNKARLIQAMLYTVGYKIKKSIQDYNMLLYTNKYYIDYRQYNFDKIWYNTWLRDYLLDGYEWGDEDNDELRFNTNIPCLDVAPDYKKVPGNSFINQIPEVLAKNNYILEA
jgi:hypothetical protein